jgi:hypothetical protein
MINIKLAVVVPKELKKQLSQSNYCKNSKTISKVARGLVNKYLLDNPNKIDLEYLYSKMKKFYEDKGYIKIDYNSNNRTPSITRNSSINFKMFEFYQDRLDNKIAGLLSKTTLPKILEILLYGYTFEEKITLEEKYFKRVCLTAKIDEKLYNDFKEDRLVKGKLISIQQACEALIKQELIKYNELEKLF